jgi:hypothetical protein
MNSEHAFERHFRVGDLATMWNLSRETVRLLVKDAPGVIKIRLGRKQSHTRYSIPASVAARIYAHLTSAQQPGPGKRLAR